jgi:uncharacterized protein YyaL (SSP411 family)
LAADRKKTTNLLINEKSPYLLQHAHNPVNWYPWGEEAFAKAQQEDKPIFLSIGYSTCHWCHVMERESFENERVAAVLNRVFVPVKVDREERPDIDTVYMNFCQALTGSGGWPLTIFMAADKKPFFAATYLPPEKAYGRPGLIELAERIEELWQKQREELIDSAEKMIMKLNKSNEQSPGGIPKEEVLNKAYEQLASRYDPQYGGFGSAPKFPTPHQLSFLLRYWKRTGIKKALEMVEKTLTAMGEGGIYDHIGFGFHRYSTDERWLLPHFEKMLYDQALLLIAYTEAYQATKNSSFAAKAEEIAAYVLRTLTDKQGGFYTAEDADSEGEEGKFYVWGTKEIKESLNEKEAEIFIRTYNLREEGNFLEETTRRRTGKNILYRREPLEKTAEKYGLTKNELLSKLETARQKLFEQREKRVHPFKDDKILTDWNGLMIASLAIAGRVLARSEYLKAAEKAATFILNHLQTEDGRLLKRYRNGEAGVAAQLDDYAFLIWGLLELYQSNFKISFLQKALTLNETMFQDFWDQKNGGYYFTAEDNEALPTRPKEVYDGALPSGNSIAALNNLRLARITADTKLEERSKSIFKAFSDKIEDYPSAYTQLLIALDYLLGPASEIIIAGEAGEPDTLAMLKYINETFLPNKIVVLRPTDEKEGENITRLAPYTREQIAVEGKATAYVCQNFSCQTPIVEPEALKELLAER